MGSRTISWDTENHRETPLEFKWRGIFYQFKSKKNNVNGGQQHRKISWKLIARMLKGRPNELSAICMLWITPPAILISCYLKKIAPIRKTRNFPNHCAQEAPAWLLPTRKAISDWFIMKNDLAVCFRSIFIKQFYSIGPIRFVATVLWKIVIDNQWEKNWPQSFLRRKLIKINLAFLWCR